MQWKDITTCTKQKSFMEERRCRFSRFHISLLDPSDSIFDHNSEVKHTHIAGT